MLLESWGSNSSLPQIARSATRPVEIYKYKSTTHILNMSAIRFSFSTVKQLHRIAGDDWRGDIIVHIKPQPV